MVEISKEVFEIINKPGRVAVLGTADKTGQSNIAYFGSLNLTEDGTVILGLGNNRSLKNLRENSKAVLFCVAEIPVTFGTAGYRLYLNAREIQDEGGLYDTVTGAIAKHSGKEAAKTIVAAVAFDVTEVRGLIDWQG